MVGEDHYRTIFSFWLLESRGCMVATRICPAAVPSVADVLHTTGTECFVCSEVFYFAHTTAGFNTSHSGVKHQHSNCIGRSNNYANPRDRAPIGEFSMPSMAPQLKTVPMTLSRLTTQFPFSSGNSCRQHHHQQQTDRRQPTTFPARCEFALQ
jgi:hypothetical protein